MATAGKDKGVPRLVRHGGVASLGFARDRRDDDPGRVVKTLSRLSGTSFVCFLGVTACSEWHLVSIRAEAGRHGDAEAGRRGTEAGRRDDPGRVVKILCRLDCATVVCFLRVTACSEWHLVSIRMNRLRRVSRGAGGLAAARRAMGGGKVRAGMEGSFREGVEARV